MILLYPEPPFYWPDSHRVSRLEAGSLDKAVMACYTADCEGVPTFFLRLRRTPAGTGSTGRRRPVKADGKRSTAGRPGPFCPFSEGQAI